MSKGLKFLVVAGLVGAGLFFAGPFILGILYFLACGGFGVVASVLAPLAPVLPYIVPATFLVLALLVVLVAVKFARKHKDNPELLNTDENIFRKNAAYIKSARAEGMSEEEIREVFTNGGWSKEESDKAFAIASTM